MDVHCTSGFGIYNFKKMTCFLWYWGPAGPTTESAESAGAMVEQGGGGTVTVT